MSEHSDIHSSLRQAVFNLLNGNPLLKPKQICNILKATKTFAYITYENNGDTVSQYKKQWKKEYRSQQGSIRSIPDEVHNTFYKGVLPENVVGEVRKRLFEVWGRAGFDRWVYPERPMTKTGWKITRSKNKFLLYKSSLGRIRFFETGTVELYVLKPASVGKCIQLFADAFVKTFLVDSIRVVDDFKSKLMVRWHGTYKTGQRLPYMKITTFVDTHQMLFVSGDRSHPDCFEFIVEYQTMNKKVMDLAEQMGKFFAEIMGNRETSSAQAKPLGDFDYSS